MKWQWRFGFRRPLIIWGLWLLAAVVTGREPQLFAGSGDIVVVRDGRVQLTIVAEDELFAATGPRSEKELLPREVVEQESK